MTAYQRTLCHIHRPRRQTTPHHLGALTHQSSAEHRRPESLVPFSETPISKRAYWSSLSCRGSQKPQAPSYQQLNSLRVLGLREMEFFDPKQLRLKDFRETSHYQSQPSRDHRLRLSSRNPHAKQCQLDGVDPTSVDTRADPSRSPPNLFDDIAALARP